VKKLLSVLLLALAFQASPALAAESAVDCHLDLCVGDRLVNISRSYRIVKIVGIEAAGKYVVQFEDTGGIGGNWDREDLAVMQGCTGDLCVGYPALNVSRSYRRVKIYALEWRTGKFILRFDDSGGIGGNWDRSDLAVAWGCVGTVCVNDTVYNTKNARQAVVAAVQVDAKTGIADQLVLDYGASGLGGKWNESDLTVLARGQTAYPPGFPVPPTYPNPSPANWQCSIVKPARYFVGQGATRESALQSVLGACARDSGGYVCRGSEAVCGIY
jgi:hypothetical protein